MPGKARIDRLLVTRGLFDSRAKAQDAIAAGLVRANGKVIAKAAEEVATDAQIEASPAHPYVSRGALKLVAALDHFKFDPKDRVCLDVGASTGGFSEVLLERDARRVYAVDVGTAQLHNSLRGNPRIVSLEQTDIRTLDAATLDPAPDFVVCDVSFISLKLVLPAALERAARPMQMIALIKPQFEAGRAHIKKGIVRDEAVRQGICAEIAALVAALGGRVLGVVPSPIEGGDGNVEYLIGATFS
ncbi:TlyA family RNA methyltransferase [Undibacter mobilis]|uniref:TlyA family RNA methyltransferase n=1 Tax=Undibacter mobilis TaxID=2292256 RepID=A0A371B3V4_9BRAD|nr:TlyA family RNA methyltransferase [Undibacter mobilis]RDV02259.1 TlyA family RNA methyltransferase [Undibacter mobilis]